MNVAEKTQVTVSMTKAKTTKGTVVFEADAPNGPVRSLYVQKGTGFDDATKVTLVVTTES